MGQPGKDDPRDAPYDVFARLDLAGHEQVRIVVSGGIDLERIAYFKEAAAPIDSFAVGSAISDASPIDFTGDLKEIEGKIYAALGIEPPRQQAAVAPVPAEANGGPQEAEPAQAA